MIFKNNHPYSCPSQWITKWHRQSGELSGPYHRVDLTSLYILPLLYIEERFSKYGPDLGTCPVLRAHPKPAESDSLNLFYTGQSPHLRLLESLVWTLVTGEAQWHLHPFQNHLRSTPKRVSAMLVLAEVVSGGENKNEKNTLLGITLAFS